MTNFQKRIATGSLYILVTISALLIHQIAGLLFLIFIQIACQFEYLNINTQMKKSEKIVSLLLGFLIFFIIILNQDSIYLEKKYTLLLVPICLVFLTYLLVQIKEKFNTTVAHIGFSILYTVLPMAFLFRSSMFSFIPKNNYLLPYEGGHILFVFILVWASDSFAYLVGKNFGKHRIAPSISPNKTFEGFAGGIIGTVLIAVCIHYFYSHIALVHFIVVGLLVAIFGFIGDLFQSKIKRSLNIKDSGNSLPGHGGFLDRFDSILFAGPVVYVYLQFII